MHELVVGPAYGRFPKSLSQKSGNNITAVPQQDTASPTPSGEWIFRSHPSHPAIERLLLAGLVEQDGQLVALDRDHVAIAEFLMEHPIADRELGGRAGRLGDQLALDGERAGAAGAGEAAHALDGRLVARACRWRVIAREGLVILAL